jgi:hypothetical protein
MTTLEFTPRNVAKFVAKAIVAGKTAQMTSRARTLAKPRRTPSRRTNVPSRESLTRILFFQTQVRGVCSEDNKTRCG